MVHESCLWYRLSRSTWFFALSEVLALQSLCVLLRTFSRATIVLGHWATTLEYTIYMPAYLLIAARASGEGRGLHWVICQYIIHLCINLEYIYKPIQQPA